MELNPQEIARLLQRQKVYEATERLVKALDDALDAIGDVQSRSRSGTEAYRMADKMLEKLQKLEGRAVALSSNVFGNQNWC